MIRIKHSIILFSFAILTIVLYGHEVRSLWAMPWDISSPEKIEQLISDALANNQTEILAEVRYRADAMYIPNKTDSTYYNPEPRNSILPKNGFDPLEYLLIRAHEQGLSVQAWLCTLNAISPSSSYLKSNYIYRNHSDWIMTDSYGNRMRGESYMGYFVDPGIPDVKYHLMNVILDIISNYPQLDGIHLDYIRYPSRGLGFAPESMVRYKEKCKTDTISWSEWRASQITDFLKDLRELALSINPRIMITAAVIASINEAEYDYSQEWVKWVNEGIIDRAYPMAYRKDYTNFYKVVDQIAQETNRKKVIVGLRAWQEKGEAYYSVDRIIEKGMLCRKMGFRGLALFSYEGCKKQNYFPRLTTDLFQESPYDEIPMVEEDFISNLIESIENQKTYSDTIRTNIANIPLENSTKVVQDSIKTTAYCDNISIEHNTYSFSFFFDGINEWSWSIIDNASNVIFQKKRVYPRGYFVEQWDGVSENGGQVQPGVYTLRLSDDKDGNIFEKRFVVN